MIIGLFERDASQVVELARSLRAIGYTVREASTIPEVLQIISTPPTMSLVLMSEEFFHVSPTLKQTFDNQLHRDIRLLFYSGPKEIATIIANLAP